MKAFLANASIDHQNIRMYSNSEIHFYESSAIWYSHPHRCMEKPVLCWKLKLLKDSTTSRCILYANDPCFRLWGRLEVGILMFSFGKKSHSDFFHISNKVWLAACRSVSLLGVLFASKRKSWLFMFYWSVGLNEGWRVRKDIYTFFKISYIKIATFSKI